MTNPVLSITQSIEKLHTALKGKKRNEDAVMEVILENPSDIRYEIRKAYFKEYNSELQADLKKELSGNFKDLCISLFDTIIEYDCKQINQSMKTFTGDNNALVEIFGTRPTWMIKMIKEEYKEMYKKDLAQEIAKETSGDFKKLLLCLCEADRSSNTNPDLEQCKEDARKLYEGGEAMWGTDEELFNQIFSKRSPHELVLIGRCYYNKTGKTLLQAIDSEFSGSAKTLFKTVLYAIINPAELFAKKVYEAIKGLGTDTTSLNRVIVTRNEVDMALISEFYKYKYNVDIKTDIIGDTSGNYQRLLVALASK